MRFLHYAGAETSLNMANNFRGLQMVNPDNVVVPRVVFRSWNAASQMIASSLVFLLLLLHLFWKVELQWHRLNRDYSLHYKTNFLPIAYYVCLTDGSDASVYLSHVTVNWTATRRDCMAFLWCVGHKIPGYWNWYHQGLWWNIHRLPFTSVFK